MAPMWLNHGPTARFSDLPFVNFRPQTLNHPLPRSARNHGCAPPHSLLFQVGTRPQLTFVNRRKSLYTGKTSKPASDAAQVGLRRELDGPGKLLAAMWLPRPAPRLPLGALAPNPWNQPLREALCSSPDVPAPNCLLRCIRLPGPPGNSDAHDQDAACSPAPSSVHGHDTANAPALPMPPMEDIHDRLAACQPSPRSRRRRVPTQPPARCRVPAI